MNLEIAYDIIYKVFYNCFTIAVHARKGRILGGLSMLGKKKAISIGMALLLLVGVAGCGSKTTPAAGDVAVKSMKVIKRDTPITYDYTGFVEAANDVQIKSITK